MRTGKRKVELFSTVTLELGCPLPCQPLPTSAISAVRRAVAGSGDTEATGLRVVKGTALSPVASPIKRADDDVEAGCETAASDLLRGRAGRFSSSSDDDEEEDDEWPWRWRRPRLTRLVKNAKSRGSVRKSAEKKIFFTQAYRQIGGEAGSSRGKKCSQSSVMTWQQRLSSGNRKKIMRDRVSASTANKISCHQRNGWQSLAHHASAIRV